MQTDHIHLYIYIYIYIYIYLHGKVLNRYFCNTYLVRKKIRIFLFSIAIKTYYCLLFFPDSIPLKFYNSTWNFSNDYRSHFYLSIHTGTHTHTHTHIYIYIYIYSQCPKRVGVDYLHIESIRNFLWIFGRARYGEYNDILAEINL